MAGGGESAVAFGQCRRNYAARQGFLVTDGCGEFTPGALVSSYCLACGCHRNFHTKITTLLPSTPAPSGSEKVAPRPVPITADKGSINLERARKNGGCGGNDGNLKNNCNKPLAPTPAAEVAAAARQEEFISFFRAAGIPVRKCKTKFTGEQVEAMREFAECLGWTMTNKEREPEVRRFCAATGLNRHTFRTWLNNNKKTYGSGGSSAAAHHGGNGSAGSSS